jgi:DNA-binding transcriptional ArsR family regulator
MAAGAGRHAKRRPARYPSWSFQASGMTGGQVSDSEAVIVRIVRVMPKRNGTGIALLADPTRRRIVALLALRPRRPSTIAREIALSRPATSRQLHLLWEAGLIRIIPVPLDGRAVLYAIDDRQHGRITAWLAGTEVGIEGMPPTAEAGRGDDTDHADS